MNCAESLELERREVGTPQTRRTAEAHIQGMGKKREGHKPTLLGAGIAHRGVKTNLARQDLRAL